jgi:putative endonuclease
MVTIMDPRSLNCEKGRRGEDLAVAFLVGKGYLILARNFRSPLGELDIVALDPRGNALVCVEVKLWSAKYYPFDDIRYSINGAKRKRLLGGFSTFIAQNPQLRYDYSRVDVICIMGDETVHIEGVC